MEIFLGKNIELQMQILVDASSVLRPASLVSSIQRLEIGMFQWLHSIQFIPTT